MDNNKEQNSSDIDLRISQIILAILDRKTFILIYIFLVTIVIACYFGLQHLKNPSTKISELNFSLTFRGASEGVYPNRSKFSEEDIINSSILQNVYDANSLKNYFGDFSSFKNTISIERYNPSLAFLTYEYKAKLSNKDLSSAERYELEQEFYRLTANIVAKPDFSLVCIYDNAHNYNIPNQLLGKTLGDILRTWAETAKTKEGATKYKISIITTPIDKSIVEDMDAFAAADYLRLTLVEIKNQIDALSELPNSTIISVKLNDKSYSLRDILSICNNTQQFVLNPLLNLILEVKPYKNKFYVNSYIENRIAKLGVSISAVNNQKETYERMLLDNIITTPDQLMKLTQEESALNREIAFYQRFLSSLKENSNVSDDDNKKIEAQLLRLKDNINQLIELSSLFYNQACEVNLNTNSGFFKINSFSSYVLQRNVSKVYLKQSFIIWAFLIALLLAIIAGKEYLQHFLNKNKPKDK